MGKSYEEKILIHSDVIIFMEKMYGIGIDEWENTMTPLHYLDAISDFFINENKNDFLKLKQENKIFCYLIRKMLSENVEINDKDLIIQTYNNMIDNK